MATPTPVGLPPITQVHTPNKSQRSTQDVRLVVVHDPEGGFDSTTNWIKQARAKVSYHVLLDFAATKARQFVPWNMKAWSCARFNSVSDNISISGFAGNTWSFSALNSLARVVAFRLHKRGLPATFIPRPINPYNPPRGWTFHSELGSAGGGHSDPGLTGVKKAFLIAAVKFHKARGRFRSRWGVGD
jgi:hypothetical protein